MLTVLVPAKDFASAKQRLSPVLASDERREFAAAMLHDTIVKLKGTSKVTEIVIVTSDPLASHIADSHRTKTIEDVGGGDLNAALSAAALQLHSQGHLRILIFPTDLLFATPDDVDRLAEEHEASKMSVTIGAARSDLGTNVLLTEACDRPFFRFGPQSSVLHLRTAIDLGLSARSAFFRNLDRDIDAVDDLRAYCAAHDDQQCSHSRRYLAKIAAAQRVS